MLGELRRQWAPEAFVVSFKLETDDQILIQKVPLKPQNARPTDEACDFTGAYFPCRHLLLQHELKMCIIHILPNHALTE